MDFSQMTKNEIIEKIKEGAIDYWSLPNSIKEDRDITIVSISILPDDLEFVPYNFKNDKEIAFLAVKKNGKSLQYLSEELRNCKDLVLEAIKNDSVAMGYVSQRLQDDEEVVLAAISNMKKNFSSLLYYVSKRLQNDKEIVLQAVLKNPESIIYASGNLQNDKELLEVIENYYVNANISINEKWYNGRMEILNNIRRKEEKDFMDNNIIPNNGFSKKLKF